MIKIPKIVHYVWLGPKQMGGLQKKCIASWKKFLPEAEWKYCLWTEQNLPGEVMQHHYVKEMYHKGKWAFVSDYIRFYILEKKGGVYLDTDTEALRAFDDLLDQGAFFGKTKDGITAAGVIGATPQHQCIKDIITVYDNDDKPSIDRTSPLTVTQVLKNGNYPDVAVYGYQYFNPCDDGEKCTPDKLVIAYTNNHWAESWVSYAKLRKILRRIGLLPFIKRFV